MDEDKIAAHNSTYPKVAVQCLNQVLSFYQSLCLVDSEVLRNRHLRVAAKRWATYKKPTAQTAHLVFADTKANAKKPKELFFANAGMILRKTVIE